MSSTTKRGRKRKLEIELDKIILQDSGQNDSALGFPAEADDSSERLIEETGLETVGDSSKPRQECVDSTKGIGICYVYKAKKPSSAFL